MSNLFKEIWNKKPHQRSRVECVAIIQRDMLIHIQEILITHSKQERNCEDTILEIKEAMEGLK